MREQLEWNGIKMQLLFHVNFLVLKYPPKKPQLRYELYYQQKRLATNLFITILIILRPKQ